MIREDEDITLLDDGADILQKRSGFRFGVDAVILADFYEGRRDAQILEVGSGTGIIPILLCQKGKAQNITAVEIQEEMADLARRNVERNGLSQEIEVIHGDVKELKRGNTYDCVISNPPYMTIVKTKKKKN